MMMDDQSRCYSVKSTATTSGLARCVCSWKNCRAFQKAYREYGHPVLDGVVKMKFIRGDTLSQPLKNSIDRTLKVSKDKRLDWKPGKRGEESITYKIARHHYTEHHILRYLNDAKSYKWTKLFTTNEAKKFLFKLDHKESVRLSDADADLYYFQCPNVSKDFVRNQFLRMKQGDAYDEDDDNKSQLGAFFKEQRHSDDTSKYGNGVDPANDKDALTVSTSRSADLLAEKERENERLRKELESCQSQLTYLHEMVRQLQEDTCEINSRRSSKSATSGRRGGNRRSHNVFPEEVCYDNGDDEDVTYGREEGVDWSEDDEEETLGDESSIPTGPGFPQGRMGLNANTNANANVNANVNANGSGSGSGGTSSAKRRTSVASRASIVSASQSIKSLPREIELAEDEANNGGSDSDDTSMEDAFDDRSYVSSHSRTSGKPDEHGRNNRNRRQRRDKNRQNRNNNRYNSHDRTGGGGSGGGGGGGSYDDIETYEVKKQVIVDPYGEKGTYAGSLSKATGMPHGKGRLEYAAGRWYEGDWKHGRWTGHGRLSNGDGDLYEGELRNDHKHGKGTMRFADGRVFVGEYINGQMIEGKMTYQDGSTYEGSWVDGMRHGRGKCVFTDNSVYEGEFREGEFHGYGKMAWSDGGWYEGEWWNGDMQGQGKEVRPDGTLRHDGQWSKGQPIRNRK